MGFRSDALAFLNGFRKFVVMMMLVVIGIIFRVTDYINGKEFVDLLSATAVAFMSFNGVEHMTKAVKAWIESKK